MRAAREAVVGTIVERGDWGRMAGVRAMPGRARVCVQGQSVIVSVEASVIVYAIPFCSITVALGQ